MNIEEYRKLAPKKRHGGETKLQIAVVEHIRSAFPQVLVCGQANEGRSAAQGAKFKAMGIRAGMSDLLLFYAPKNALAIELKRHGNYQQANQKGFEHLFTRCGFDYAVCKSVDEVHKLLIAQGLNPVHNAVKEPDLRTQAQKVQMALDWNRP